MTDRHQPFIDALIEQDFPIQIISRIDAEFKCMDAHMNMNKLMFLRLYAESVEPHGPTPINPGATSPLKY